MAIDFLGKQAPKKAVKSGQKFEMHNPVTAKPAALVIAPKTIEPNKIPEPAALEREEVNLMSPFKAYLLKRRLEIILIILIFTIIFGGLATYFFTRPRIIANNNLNQPIVNQPIENVNLPLPVNENLNQAVANINANINENLNIAPPVLPEFPPVTLPLANTELAPLRGALVKFSGSADIYLVEWQGELRLVDQQSVVFKNGQTVKQLSAKLVYTLNERFKDIRQGLEVKGNVAWDPRVLGSVELELFK